MDKGFAVTLVGGELVGPKRKGNSVSCAESLLLQVFSAVARKGNRLIFLYQDVDFSGNANEAGDVCRSPGLSYLFSLTAAYPGTKSSKKTPECDCREKGCLKAGKVVRSLGHPERYDRPLKIQRNE